MKPTQINRLILLLFVVIVLFVVIDHGSQKSFPSPTIFPTPIPATPIPKNIDIQTPKMNAEITSGFLFSGTVRVFEKEINYRLKDTKNNILAQGKITDQKFEQKIFYTVPKTQFGYLEVVTGSDKQIIYLKFGQ